MTRFQTLCCLACSLPVALASAADPLEAGREYVRGVDGCGLDHGYVCVEPREEDFLSLEADRGMLSGNWLKAWQAAWAAFLDIEDLEAEQREPRHYKFGFAESESAYIIHFQPLLLPGMKDGVASGIVRDAIGRQTRYWIDKKNFSVARRLFYK